MTRKQGWLLKGAEVNLNFDKTLVPRDGVEVTLEDYDGFCMLYEWSSPQDTLALAVATVLVIKTKERVSCDEDFIRRIRATKLDVAARKISVRILPN